MNPLCAVLIAGLCFPKGAQVVNRVNSPVGGNVKVVTVSAEYRVETYTDAIERTPADARIHCEAEACIRFAWESVTYNPAARRLRFYGWGGAVFMDVSPRNGWDVARALEEAQVRFVTRKGKVLVPLSALAPVP